MYGREKQFLIYQKNTDDLVTGYGKNLEPSVFPNK